MALEDFTSGWSETDPGNDITRTSTKVDCVTLERGTSSYVSKDFGAGFFSGDFNFAFEMYVGSTVGNGTFPGAICLSQTADDWDAVRTSDSFSITFDTVADVSIRGTVGGTTQGQAVAGDTAEGTLYFMELNRNDDGGGSSAGLYTLYIRTESHTGPLVDTLALSFSTAIDFRYVLVAQMQDSNTGSITGYIQNLDLEFTNVYEDFIDDYTETDGGSDLTVSQRTIDWAAMPWNVDNEVFRDFGVDYFVGDFNIRYEYQIDVDNGSYMGAFIIANEPENSGYWNSNIPYIRMYWSTATTSLWLNTKSVSGENSDTAIAMTLGTRYYITVDRDDDGGTGTGVVVATIRTGSHTGTVFDTLTSNCDDQIDFRYLLACTSHNAGGAQTSDGSVHNYEIVSVEAGGGGPAGVDLIMGKTVAQVDLFMGVPIANIDLIMGS